MPMTLTVMKMMIMIDLVKHYPIIQWSLYLWYFSQSLTWWSICKYNVQHDPVIFTLMLLVSTNHRLKMLNIAIKASTFVEAFIAIFNIDILTHWHIDYILLIDSGPPVLYLQPIKRTKFAGTLRTQHLRKNLNVESFVVSSIWKFCVEPSVKYSIVK